MATTSPAHFSRSHLPCRAAIVFTTLKDNPIFFVGGLIAALRNEDVPVSLVSAFSNDGRLADKHGDMTRQQAYRQATEILGGACLQETVLSLALDEPTISSAMVAIEAAGADLVLVPSIDSGDVNARTMAWLAIEATRRLFGENSALHIGFYGMNISSHPENVRIDISPWHQLKSQSLDCLHRLETREASDEQPNVSKKNNHFTEGSSIGSTETLRVLSGRRLAHPVMLIEEASQADDCLPLGGCEDGLGKVAILIRSIDRENLRRALDSVALQTYSNIEVHILNVTGRPHRPISPRAGRFRVFFHDPGIRLLRSAAANKLLDHANGDFALFLDDDDWLAPNHISLLVSALESHPNIVGTYSSVEYGVLDGNQWKPETVFSSGFDRHRLLFENYLPIHSVLFRLSSIKHPEGKLLSCRFDESLDLFEDWDFWLQATAYRPLVHIDAVSAYYLRNQDSNSGAFDDGEMQRNLRHKLQKKWLSLLDITAYGEFLDYVQTLYRESAMLKLSVAQLNDQYLKTDQYNRSLEAILAARKTELTNTRKHLASTQEILAARETELQNLHVHAGNLEEILGIRDAELNQLRADCNWLRDELRENEISLDNVQKHADGLGEIILARDTEVKTLHEDVHALTELMAERDRELTDLCKPFWRRKKHV